MHVYIHTYCPSGRQVVYAYRLSTQLRCITGKTDSTRLGSSRVVMLVGWLVVNNKPRPNETKQVESKRNEWNRNETKRFIRTNRMDKTPKSVRISQGFRSSEDVGRNKQCCVVDIIHSVYWIAGRSNARLRDARRHPRYKQKLDFDSVLLNVRGFSRTFPQQPRIQTIFI